MVAPLKDYDEDDDTTPHSVVVQIFPEKDDFSDEETDRCSLRGGGGTPQMRRCPSSGGTRSSDGRSRSSAGEDFEDTDDEVIFPPGSKWGDVASPEPPSRSESCVCERERPGVPRRDFQVEIERQAGEQEELGLDVAKHERFLYVSLVKPGLLLHRLGVQHPDQCVKAGDCIIEVNGQEGTSEELVSRVKGSLKMTLTVRRFLEFTVALERPGRLGIDIGFTAATLKVLTLTTGQIEEWNAKATPETEVRAGDYIVQAHGVRGTSSQLLKVMKSDTWPMTMVLVRGSGPPTAEEVAGTTEPSPPPRPPTPSCCQHLAASTPAARLPAGFSPCARAGAARPAAAAGEFRRPLAAKPRSRHCGQGESGRWKEWKAKASSNEASEDETRNRREHVALQVW